MFRVDKNEVISELNLSLFGAKGFMQDRNKECPFCNKKGKWGIKFNDAGNNGAFHCFKSSSIAFNIMPSYSNTSPTLYLFISSKLIHKQYIPKKMFFTVFHLLFLPPLRRHYKDKIML